MWIMWLTDPQFFPKNTWKHAVVSQASAYLQIICSPLLTLAQHIVQLKYLFVSVKNLGQYRHYNLVY